MVSISINIGIDETERKSIGIISNLTSKVRYRPSLLSIVASSPLMRSVMWEYSDYVT